MDLRLAPDSPARVVRLFAGRVWQKCCDGGSYSKRVSRMGICSSPWSDKDGDMWTGKKQ